MRKLFAIVAAVAIAFDQTTKALARAHLPRDREVLFAGKFWRWSLSFNPGMAFSQLTHAGWLLLLVALVASVVVAVRVWREPRWRPVYAVGMALIAGGALGNAIDRIFSGKVTDFIQWGSWPVFNVADALLFSGVALLLLEPKASRTAA